MHNLLGHLLPVETIHPSALEVNIVTLVLVPRQVPLTVVVATLLQHLRSISIILSAFLPCWLVGWLVVCLVDWLIGCG